MKKDIKELFLGWYDYPKREYEIIMKNGVISFDTNIFLNLYRYSKQTTVNTLNRIKTIQDRIVTSYYVAEEFSRDRRKVESDSIIEYDKYKDELNNKYDDLLKEMNNIRDNKISNHDKLIKQVEKNRDSILAAIDNDKAEKQKMFKDGLEEDICNLISLNITEKFSDDKFEIIKQEGLRRFKEQIPPGYKDNDKEENGDYYIFASLIDYCEKNKKDLIFVTEDSKEDMFQNINGIKIPRAELINEFFEKTKKKIIIIRLKDFITNDFVFPSKIDQSTLNEISSLSYETFITRDHINSRLERNWNRLFKYNTIEKIIDNKEELLSICRYIIRMSLDSKNNEKFVQAKIFYDLLNSNDYSSYLSSLSALDDSKKKSQNDDYNNIMGSIKEIASFDKTKMVDIIDNMINYLNSYENNGYKKSILTERLVTIKSDLEKNNISMEMAKKYIAITFDDFSISYK